MFKKIRINNPCSLKNLAHQHRFIENLVHQNWFIKNLVHGSRFIGNCDQSNVYLTKDNLAAGRRWRIMLRLPSLNGVTWLLYISSNLFFLFTFFLSLSAPLKHSRKFLRARISYFFCTLLSSWPDLLVWDAPKLRNVWVNPDFRMSLVSQTSNW